jgi:hypothetical protein
MKGKFNPVKAGEIFDHLTVLEATDGRVNKNILYLCICDCSQKLCLATGVDLRRKAVKSCGCLKKPNGEVTINSFINRYKYSARKRDLLYLLTDEEAIGLFKGKCHYCDAVPLPRTYRIGATAIELNGIDRVDSSIGYSVSNCVSCCYICNTLKMDYTKEEFLSHIEKIHAHQQTKQEKA